MNFLPPGSVRTGPPVNLCADLTSGSPKNSKHLIWNLSVRPLSITAYPLQRCREAPESSRHGQKVGFNRQVARSSRGWDTPTNRSHSQSLRVVNQLTSPCFCLSRVSLLVFDPYMKAETGPSKSVWLQKIHDRFFKPLLIIRTSDVTTRRWRSQPLGVFEVLVWVVRDDLSFNQQSLHCQNMFKENMKRVLWSFTKACCQTRDDYHGQVLRFLGWIIVSLMWRCCTLVIKKCQWHSWFGFSSHDPHFLLLRLLMVAAWKDVLTSATECTSGHLFETKAQAWDTRIFYFTAFISSVFCSSY